jgi:hypothetical protein
MSGGKIIGGLGALGLALTPDDAQAGTPLWFSSNLLKFLKKRQNQSMPPEQWMRTLWRMPEEAKTPQLSLFKAPPPEFDIRRAVPAVPGIGARELREADIASALQQLKDAGVKRVSGRELYDKVNEILPEGEIMEFRGVPINESALWDAAEQNIRDYAEEQVRYADVKVDRVEDNPAGGVDVWYRGLDSDDNEIVHDHVFIPSEDINFYGSVEDALRANRDVMNDLEDRIYRHYVEDSDSIQAEYDRLLEEARDNIPENADGVAHHADYFPHANEYAEVALSLPRRGEHPLSSEDEWDDAFHGSGDSVPGYMGHMLLDLSPSRAKPGFAHLLEIQAGDPIKRAAKDKNLDARVFDINTVYPALIKTLGQYLVDNDLKGVYLPKPEQIINRWRYNFHMADPNKLELVHFIDREGGDPIYKLFANSKYAGEFKSLNDIKRLIGDNNFDALIRSEFDTPNKNMLADSDAKAHRYIPDFSLQPTDEIKMPSRRYDPVILQRLESIPDADVKIPVGDDKGLSLYRFYSQLPSMIEKTLGKYGVKVIPPQKETRLYSGEFVPEAQPRVEIGDEFRRALYNNEIPLFAKGGAV